MSTRKRWRLKMIPTFTEWPAPSMKKAYEMVEQRRRDYADGSGRVHHVNVEVNEGSGWKLYERIIFPPRTQEEA